VEGVLKTNGAVLRLAALALMWGSTYLWIKVALAGFTPVQVTIIRSALGAVVLTVVATRLPRGAIWGRIAIAALFGNALPYALFSMAERTVDSRVAGVLNATTPLWSLLIAVGIGTERRPRPARFAGLLLGFAGVLVIFAPWQRSGFLSWGCLALLAAAASYAIGFAYMGRKLAGQGVPTIVLSAAQLIVATGMSVLTVPAGGLVAPHLTVVAVVAVIVLGVMCTGVTFHLTYRMIADEGATTAASVSYLLPVVSVALGVLVVHEHFTGRELAGMVIVLIGVALVKRGGGRRKSRRHHDLTSPTAAR
jgi:drug/metabolite transporter (DMT)-like permease